MFVFAADDVSKKDLRKISKKIERQIAKWEEKDKRKRDNDSDVETSTKICNKKVKGENESVNTKEIISEEKGENSKVNHLQAVDSSGHDDASNSECSMVQNSTLEECELIVDVNEAGLCDITVVSSDSAINLKDDLNDRSPSKCTNDRPKPLHDTRNKNTYENEIKERADSIIEEFEVIVDVNEKGFCDFTMSSCNSDIDMKDNEKIHTEASDKLQGSSFYLCKCGSDGNPNESDSVCNFCVKKCVSQIFFSTPENQSYLTSSKSSIDTYDSEKKVDNSLPETESSDSKGTCSKSVINHYSCSSENEVEDELPKVETIQSVEAYDVSAGLDGRKEKTVRLNDDLPSSADNFKQCTDCHLNEDCIIMEDSEEESENETEVKSIARKEWSWDIPAESDVVALDCEFVGVGSNNQSALGRCSIVDFHGRVLCDIYAQPEERITDYRTRWSGITRNHMKRAIPIHSALSQIANIIRNKVVVGHAVYNDFQVLCIPHPKSLIRDTSKYKPLKEKLNTSQSNMNQGVSLKKLALHLLGRVIQTGGHCSVEDSRATMDIYKLVRDDWEKRILQGQPVQDEIVKLSKCEKRKRKRRRELERAHNLRRNKSAVGFILNQSVRSEAQYHNFHRSRSDSNLWTNQYGLVRNNCFNDNFVENRNYDNGYQYLQNDRPVMYNSFRSQRTFYHNDGYYHDSGGVNWSAQYLGDQYWQDVSYDDNNLFDNYWE